MLTIDIARLCSDRNITHPRKFLLALGFYPQAVTLILSGKRARLDNRQLEQLCLALRCTPNDLYSWHPGQATVDEQHPIRDLVRPAKPSISELLNKVNHEEIEELRALIEAKVKGG